MNIGDEVRVLSVGHQNEVFTIQKMGINIAGDTCLYLQRGNVVIFRTSKQVELITYLCLACGGDGDCDHCTDGTMSAQECEDYADSIVDPM